MRFAFACINFPLTTRTHKHSHTIAIDLNTRIFWFVRFLYQFHSTFCGNCSKRRDGEREEAHAWEKSVFFFSSPLSGITRCFSYDYFSFVVDSHVTRWLKSCLKWWNAINATLLIIIIGMMKKKRRLPIAHFYIHLNLYAHRTHICCFFLSFIWFLLFGINWCWSLRIVYFISIGGCIFFSLHSSLLFSFVSLFVFI